MTASLALTLWLSVAGQLPIATQAQLPTGETVELAAEQLLYEPQKQILTLRGNTVLRSASVLLRADEITYDQKAEKATARGNVMLVAAGNVAAVAEEIQVDIRSFEATVKGGLFMQKKNVTQEALLAAKNPEELKALGDTAILIQGTRIRRTDTAAFSVEDISFTPCDCKPWEPSWRVEASKASVEVGEHAVLSWPRVYVYDVPVFALPWIDLPLTDRRTGLLVPKPLTGGNTGLGLEQPVFFELGDSYDVTLTPAYFHGTPDQPPFGVRGGRLLTEFRYAPAEQLRGRVSLALLYDTWEKRHPLDYNRKLGPRRGLRGELLVQHAHELGNGFHTRVDASAVSDGHYILDLQADVLQREVMYLRSTAAAYHRGEDHYAGLDVVLRQPLPLYLGFSLLREDVVDGQVLRGPNPLHRLPALTAGLPERHLFGPLFGGVDAELSRIAPLTTGFGDEGVDGVFDVPSVEAERFARGQGDRHFDPGGPDEPGERQARYRLSLNPRLSLPVALGSYARFTPYVRYRQDVYLGEYDGRFAQRGYGLLGALAETELSRTFGDRLRHAINPRAELRWVPAISGAPLGYYDELDRAPVTEETSRRYGAVAVTSPKTVQPGFLHGQVEVSQRLSLRNEGQVRELGRFDVGQTADLGYAAAARLGESYVRFVTSLDRLQLDAIVRLDPRRRFAVTQFVASAGVNDGRGNGLYARYDNVLTPGSERMRRPLDTFVAPVFETGESLRGNRLVAGGSANLPWGISLRYEAAIAPGAVGFIPEQNQVGPLSPIEQQVLAVGYGPACGCWRLEVNALVQRDPKHPESWHRFDLPRVNGTLTLGQFGTFGR